MKIQLIYWLDRLRESFWFVPIIMVGVAIALSPASVGLDRVSSLLPMDELMWFPRLDPDSARLLLSTVSGAMITSASLVFSLTLVALTLASQQLGPRLLSTFLRDRITQVVLGLFLATFIYAMLVLTALGDDAPADVVPRLSIVIVIGLTIASLITLILFIHHLAVSLQADVVIARVAEQLHEQMALLFPDRDEDDDSRSRDDEWPDAEHTQIASNDHGYLQAVDHDALLELAVEQGLKIRLLHRPGHFVSRAEPIACVQPASVDPQCYTDALNRAVVLGSRRTPTQDPEFALMAIVEIALRALSPSINDPHTANTCVDRLGDCLTLVFERRLRAGIYRDKAGEPRLFLDVTTVDGLLDAAFNEIRQSADGVVSVLVRMAEAMQRLAPCARNTQQREAVERHCSLIRRAAERTVGEQEDLDCITRALGAAQDLLS